MCHKKTTSHPQSHLHLPKHHTEALRQKLKMSLLSVAHFSSSFSFKQEKHYTFTRAAPLPLATSGSKATFYTWFCGRMLPVRKAASLQQLISHTGLLIKPHIKLISMCQSGSGRKTWGRSFKWNEKREHFWGKNQTIPQGYVTSRKWTCCNTKWENCS